MTINIFKEGSDTCSKEIQGIVMVLMGIALTTFIALSAIGARQKGTTLEDIWGGTSCTNACKEVKKVDTTICKSKSVFAPFSGEVLTTIENAECSTCPSSSKSKNKLSSKAKTAIVILVISIAVIIVLILFMVFNSTPTVEKQPLDEYEDFMKTQMQQTQPQPPPRVSQLDSTVVPPVVITRPPPPVGSYYACGDKCAFGSENDISKYQNVLGPDYRLLQRESEKMRY